VRRQGAAARRASFAGEASARARLGGFPRATRPHARNTLPQSAFKAITRARLPYPLLFTVMSERAARARDEASARASAAAAAAAPAARGPRGPPRGTAGPPPPPPAPARLHVCGVLEFSASEGTAALPAWLLADAGLRAGEAARLTVVRGGLPAGGGAALAPAAPAAFAAAAEAAGGARAALEAALRAYLALARGARIVVDVGGVRHVLAVTAVRARGAAGGAGAGAVPPPAVSLLGDVDLEVDIVGGAAEALQALAPAFAALAVEAAGEDAAAAAPSSSSGAELEPQLSAPHMAELMPAVPPPTEPLAEAPQVAAVAIFAGVGARATVAAGESDAAACARCGAAVPATNARLHALACARARP
jgi:hypothetical protein